MRYLLDANIIFEMIRNPHRKASPRLVAQVEAVLEAIEVLPFEEPRDRVYGALRCRLKKRSIDRG